MHVFQLFGRLDSSDTVMKTLSILLPPSKMVEGSPAKLTLQYLPPRVYECHQVTVRLYLAYILRAGIVAYFGINRVTLLFWFSADTTNKNHY